METPRATPRPHTLASYEAIAKDLGLPRRAAREMYNAAAARRLARALPVRISLADRLSDSYVQTIGERGGITQIPLEHRRFAKMRCIDTATIAGRTYRLFYAEGWRKYSRQHVHHVAYAYLAGRDDNGRWAVRVPSTIGTASAALAWITPREVHAAQAAGKRVWRQGDVWAVETSGRNDAKGLEHVPASHTWDSAARTLRHPSHAPLHLPGPVRFYMGQALKNANLD